MIHLLHGALAAASALGLAPAQAQAPYIVLGAPQIGEGRGFRALIADGVLLLESPTSAGWYRLPLPLPPVAESPAPPGATRLTIAPGGCAEADAPLPDAVTLEWDGGRFHGCGGPRPPAPTAGAVWELARIGGAQAPDSRSPAATLVLGRDGSVGGSLNCNSGSLEERRWTADGRFVGRSGGFMQTQIGCYDAGEAFGRRFWTAMATARGWRREGDRLFIRFADGTEAELRYLVPPRT